MNTYIVGLKNGEKLRVKGFLKNNFEIGDSDGKDGKGFKLIARFNPDECLYIIKDEHLEIETPTKP